MIFFSRLTREGEEIKDPLKFRCVLHQHEKTETFIVKQKDKGLSPCKLYIKTVHHFVCLNDDKKVTDDKKEKKPSRKKVNTGGAPSGSFWFPRRLHPRWT
jgi:hypothetical protein